MNLTTFKGLNNATDPLRAGPGWLSAAVNVDITDRGAIEKRDGYSLVRAGTFKGIYTTNDFQRMYLADANSIQTFDGVVIASLTSTDPIYWTEVNGDVYFNNGTDDGVISPDNSVIRWRRDIKVNQYMGADGQLLSSLLDPAPFGTDIIQHWLGRIYVCQYMPTLDQTVVWFSLPLGYHLFSLDSDYFVMPGRVLMLAPADNSLIIGTERSIHAFSGERLEKLADYGVVPGHHWVEDITAEGQKRTLFWTKRGLCSATPFLNLTERQVSVAPGLEAGGVLMQKGGQKRYLTVLKAGGHAFNSIV